VTPFDVIKTRIQTQTSPEPLFQASRTSPPGITCCHTTDIAEKPGLLCQHDPRIEPRVTTSSAKARINRSAVLSHSGGLTSNGAKILRLSPQPSNSMSAIACAFPDRSTAMQELDKTRNHGRMGGLWDGVIKIGRAEGRRGLWRGLTPTLIMTVPSQVTYMTCYDSFRHYFMSLDSSPRATSKTPSFSNISSHTLMSSLASGALARGISATLVTPLELLRTRLQASSSTSASRNLTSILVELGSQVRREGPTVMFRGLVPTLYRDVPFSAIYFAGYESMKRVLTGSGLGEGNADDGRGKEFGVAFISGSTSGILAALLTQPFDLIKTRLQAEEAQSNKRMSGMFTVWKQIVQNDGYAGLFRGLSPRVAKVAPACGIMIASFEFIGRWLQERTNSREESNGNARY
jgi:solute carrier family 25 protein 39/40